jgi:hypothetical protein
MDSKGVGRQQMIDILSPRQNKFGFYQVGALQTYSKARAVEYHNKTKEKIHWHFNDENYKIYDWTQEPTESLSELYRQRAQQLRDQYDYLVLWFSGGADSTNILNTFIDNNIKLDEVASYVNYEATGDKLNPFNAEIFHVADPVVNVAKQKQPWLKHTVIDVAPLTMKYFADPSVKFDWTYFVNTHVNPNTVSRRDIKLQVPYWTKMFDTGKKVGFINGIDKPKVTGLNQKYYYQFYEVIDGAVTPEIQMLNRSWDFNELFYWPEDHPKIAIKQGHVIKNFLKTCQRSSPSFTDNKLLASTVSVANAGDTSDQFGVLNYTGKDRKKIQYLTLPGLHTLIYPKWQPVLYQVKPPSLTFSFRDTWFFNQSNNESTKYAWQTGLNHRWNSTPAGLKNDWQNIHAGFKYLLGPTYCLGT